MAKDPAFLFYPGDFTTGTQFFTDEQVGKYIRLLMAQHQLGRLKENHMIMICKSYDNDIFSKFVKDSNGCYYNERLEDEIVKRKKYTESRGNNKRGKKIISSSYDNHMENENRNIDISNNINNNISVVKFFESLLNGSELEIIAMNNKLTINQVKECVELFRPKSEVSYPTYAKFVSHFKNWLNKNPYKDPDKLKMVY